MDFSLISTEPLSQTQYSYGSYPTARSAITRRPLPRQTATQTESSTSHDYKSYSYFLVAARKHECKSYKLHKNIHARAVAKNAQLEFKERHENPDWNFVFPPSVVKRQCNATVVQELLDCCCRICGSFGVDPNEDVSLISSVEDDMEVRFSIAVLAYMGAGFAIRSLRSSGLGTSGSSLSTILDSASFRERLFDPLQREPKIPDFQKDGIDRPLEDMARDFSIFYEETRMALRSPKLEANMTTTALQGCNLPFLKESSLDPEDPSRYPHVSILNIHSEYCASIPTGQLVRKKLQRASGINDESAGEEKNILKSIAGLNHKNIIKLCFWFTYDNTINLVFPKYPATLEDVLLERWVPARRSQFSSKFRGSRLNHWLWEEGVDIIGALDYIHQSGTFNDENITMAHFNLKPANILVNEEGHLVITDFGIARIKSLANGDTTRLVGGVGTLTYAPPEGNKLTNLRLSRAYDVWSMGCILLEIVLFVLYDKGPKNDTSEILGFAKARLEEGNRRNVQVDYSFWIEKGRSSAMLKECVDERLKKIERFDDAYMKRVGYEIRNFMLNTAASVRHPAKTCYSLLKASDRSLVHREMSFSGDQIVAVGEDTENPIHRMVVFFDSKDPERLSQPSIDCQLRCFLVRSSSPKRDKWQMAMKYKLNNCEQERSDCGYVHEEEFVPISSYINPRTPGTPFQFRLSSIHPQIVFKLNDERNFFQVQAAITRQQVRVPTKGLSDLPIKRCWFKRSGIVSQFDNLCRLRVSGCVQIWDQLSEKEYRDSIISDKRRLLVPYSGSGSNSTGNFHLLRSLTGMKITESIIQDAAPNESTHANPTRIAIFLCSDPAQSQDLTLMTLNMAFLAQRAGSEHICEEKENSYLGNYEACVTFSTLPGHESFHAGCFRETTKADATGTPINISPGIPLDPMALNEKEEKEGTSLDWLELEFNTREDRENFQRRVNQNRLEPYTI